MQSWIEYEIQFKNTCPENMGRYIRFIRSHHGYSNEKIAQNLPEYVELIQHGVIATDYGNVLIRERIN